MKLYRVDFHDAAKGLTHTWHSNRAKAQVTLLQLQLQREARSRGVACLGTEAVEAVTFPETRNGVLMWLNDHVGQPRAGRAASEMV